MSATTRRPTRARRLLTCLAATVLVLTAAPTAAPTASAAAPVSVRATMNTGACAAVGTAVRSATNPREFTLVGAPAEEFCKLGGLAKIRVGYLTNGAPRTMRFRVSCRYQSPPTQTWATGISFQAVPGQVAQHTFVAPRPLQANRADCDVDVRDVAAGQTRFVSWLGVKEYGGVLYLGSDGGWVLPYNGGFILRGVPQIAP